MHQTNLADMNTRFSAPPCLVSHWDLVLLLLYDKKIEKERDLTLMLYMHIPSLSPFLTSVPQDNTNMHFLFAYEQKSNRRDVER